VRYLWPLLLVALVIGGPAFIALRIRSRQNRAAELAEAERQQVEAERVREVRSREIAPYHQMSYSEFEHALAYLCERDGCTGVVVTGKAGDFGADVTALTPTGHKLVLQAKRYVSGNLVSSPDVQKVAGTCRTMHNADIAAVVTTSSFTAQARVIAERADIVLFDADALADWASGAGPAPWGGMVPPAALPPAGYGSNGSRPDDGEQPKGRHARPEEATS
jgi:restriction system protein